ncbi:plasmid pRiA4b ORF-3-like family protein [Thauera sp. SWB20]|nr:plasmid pRiA4b ORF-3-like family protein [Thauera sp. SWB20]
MSRKSVVKAYTLRIELQEVEPLIWRRLLVDGDTTLGKLHHYVQAAMGWTDAHLHEFEIGGKTYAT